MLSILRARSRAAALASASFVLGVSFTSFNASAQNVLRVSAIPDEAPTELQRKFTPLGAYLEKELGMRVTFVPVSDYPAVVESLSTKKLDMAWLGGVTYVQAKIMSKGAVVPLVQRAEDAVFTSRFITANPAITTLGELKGKTFAFGSPSSTSGHLMPRYFMMQAGLNMDRDFKNLAFSGAHDATVAFVASGKAEAGVLNSSVWDKMVEEKKVDASKVKVFATTPPYFDYNWTVRGEMDAGLRKRITDAFLKLDPANAAHKEIMGLQRASKFIATQASNYDGIEKAGIAAGFFK